MVIYLASFENWYNVYAKGKNILPKKIRELKAMLLKAGCICDQGKGSHTKWSHPLLRYKITVSVDTPHE